MEERPDGSSEATASDRLRRVEDLVRGAKQRAQDVLGLPERVGAYRVEGLLGEGGMGKVLVARDERLDRLVAVKLIRPEYRLSAEARARFWREARAASRLDDPGIARVYEVGEHDGAPFLAMELVSGRSLAERLEASRLAGARCLEIEGSGAPELRLAALFERVARSLHEAHGKGLVHRDVKPSNLMVTESGSPVLLDFGVARDARDADQALTLTGQLVGTPLYLPPERIVRQNAEDDPRGDVYSLGVTLYECLTLQRPFDGATQHEVLDRVLRDEPIRPRRFNPGVPRDLEVVVRTAIEKDLARRYATALDLAEDLRRVRTHEPIRARPAGPWLRLRRFAQRNPIGAAFVALLLVASLTTGWLLLESERARAAAAENLRRFHLLGTRVLLAQALEAEPWQLEARPETVPVLRRWLAEQAEPLLAQRPALQAELAALRQRSKPYTDERQKLDAERLPRRREHEALLEQQRRWQAELAKLGEQDPPSTTAEAARLRFQRRQYARKQLEDLAPRLSALGEDPGLLRTFEFEDAADRFLHDALGMLVQELRELERHEVARVRDSLAFAESVADRTLHDPEAARLWRAACDGVRTSPHYGGLELRAQLGLVPLGPDPDSKLWEFAHLRSGAVPERDPATGRLRLGDDAAIVLVLIPGGSFAMGAQSADPAAASYSAAAEADEAPVSEVRLAPFFLAKHELTQAQWRALDWGAEPSQYKAGRSYGERAITPRNPVEHVSWTDCDRVLRRHGLVLPTEAQWERACRGGTAWPWYSGALPRSLAGHANLGDRFAARFNPSWLKERWLDDGHYVHAPAASYAANPFGLHDVIGNVAEWCRDWFGGYDLPQGPGDGLRLVHGFTDTRVLRGGAFDYAADACRASRRDAWPPDTRSAAIGGRAARAIEP